VEKPSSDHRWRLNLTFQLPPDAASVPLARHLIREAMRDLGVTDDDRDAVELALSEACTNVVCHARPRDLYEIAIAIDAAACRVRIVDQGGGSITASATTMPQPSAERGRGLALMRH
jgi:serine/threonine-protein kinase RsbW